MTALRFAPVGVWLAALIACLAIISHTPFTADLSAFLPRSPSQSEQVLVEQLRDGAVSRVILLGIEGVPGTQLTTLSKNFAKRLREEPSFLSVNNGENTNLTQDQAFLWDNRYLLSSAVTPEHFTEAGLRDALQAGVDLLNGSAAVLVKSLLPRDPTGEMLHLSDEVAPTSQPATMDGVWVSEDGSTALLVLQTRAAMSDVDAQEAGLIRIREAFDAARAQTQGSAAARLVETGPVVFSVATRERIRSNAVLFSMIATAMVTGLLLLVYRSLPALFFSLLPVGSGIMAGIAAVSLSYGTVHAITLGFGVTLIGEAVDYPIYLFTQTIPGTRPRDTMARIWPTLRQGLLTSVFGFGAMLFSGFEGLAQLGAFSIAGLITALAVTRFVLPVLIPPGFQMRRPVAIGAALRRLIDFAPRLRIPSLALVAGAVLFLAVEQGNLWNDELASLSPISNSDKETDQRLRNQLGAPDAGFLLIVNGPDEESTRQQCERVTAELQRLVEQNVLAGFQSPVSLLPSRAAQEARQKAIPARAELTARFNRALETMPFEAETYAPFFNDAETSRTRPLVERGSLDGTTFGVLADMLLMQRGESWQALFPLRGVSDPARMAAEIDRLAIPDVVFLNIKQDSDALFSAYRRQAVMLSLGGVLAILLLLAASLRSMRRVVLVVSPLAASVLVTAALLLFSGQRLTIFHLVGLLLVVAVGSNYSLFFERNGEAGETREWVVASLALANLSTIIGFGVLSFSQIPVLHGIGITVALGTFLSLCFSAILSKRQEMSDAAMLETVMRG
jgi:predicted exporter